MTARRNLHCLASAALIAAAVTFAGATPAAAACSADFKTVFESRLAAAGSDDKDTAAKGVSELNSMIDFVQLNEDCWKDAGETYRRIADIARKHTGGTPSRLEGISLQYRGKYYMREKQWKKAVPALEDSLAYMVQRREHANLPETGLWLEEANARTRLMVGYYRVKDYAKAEMQGLAALKLFEHGRDESNVKRALKNLAFIYKASGESEKRAGIEARLKSME